MYQSVDVAAISFRPKKFALADNADRLEEMFRAAAKGGAQLALAPEGVLEGYVVMELIAGEEPAERMRDVAVTMHDPVMGRSGSHPAHACTLSATHQRLIAPVLL